MPKASHIRSGTSLTVAHLTRKNGGNDRRLVAITELFPKDEIRYSLGLYDERHPPKGFIIELEPNIEPSTLTSKIVATRVNGLLYGLELRLASSSNENINVKVWEL